MCIYIYVYISVYVYIQIYLIYIHTQRLYVRTAVPQTPNRVAHCLLAFKKGTGEKIPTVVVPTDTHVPFISFPQEPV